MKAMKFRVESPEHSRQIQERLFEMGYEWLFIENPNKTVSFVNKPFILAKNGRLTHFTDNDYFNSLPHQLTTLQDIPWQPKQGEMIEVSCDGQTWGYESVKFIGMDDEYFVVLNKDDYYAVGYARPINTIQREIDELQKKIDELKKML